MGDLGQKGIKCRRSSALDAVLSTLCPVHCSLLYQILKQAQEEKLPSLLNGKPTGQAKTCFGHSGVQPHDNGNLHAVKISECSTHNSCLYYPLRDCEHGGHRSTVCHSGDPKSNCSINLYSLKDCRNDSSLDSSFCCVQRSRMETYTVLCPKRLQCISCHSLAVGHINNLVCSFTSSPTLPNSPSLCTPSTSLCPSSPTCCHQLTQHHGHCHSNQPCQKQTGSTTEMEVKDGDPPCPVLKREQSPSPPPLSPIPSDISKKMDEKPPSLLHHKQEETSKMVKNDLVNGSHQKTDVNSASDEELQCRTPKIHQAEHNPSGTSLQDVVSRFTERLETIKPLERDPPLDSLTNNFSEKEQLHSPSTSLNLQFHADAHLTEIITKVLRNDNDYNLSELFNRHDSKEPKSPNTRSRRRQEVLAAIATPADDSSARRHTLQMKREFARLDQSFNRRKVSPAKKAKLNDGQVTETTSFTSSDSNQVKVESKPEPEGSEIAIGSHEVPELPLPVERILHEVKDEIQTVIVSDDIQILKAEESEWEINCEEKDGSRPSTQIPTLQQQSKLGNQGTTNSNEQNVAGTMTVTLTSGQHCIRTCTEGGEVYAESDKNTDEATSGQHSGSDKKIGNCKDINNSVGQKQTYQANHSKESRRTKRNIVPPQRFSSYVTEPRKMFFVACFSESIFNQRPEKDNVLTSDSLDTISTHPNGKVTQLESRNDISLSSSEHKEEPVRESPHEKHCGASSTAAETMTGKENSPTKCKTADNNSAAKTMWLRSSPKRLQDSPTAPTWPKKLSNRNDTVKSSPSIEHSPNSSVEYTSPIKLMFVSAVRDKEGVRYSLKSAKSGPSSKTEVSFDPCVVSSWSGTLEKPSAKFLSSKLKSSPLKSSTSPSKTTSPQSKSGSYPSNSATSPSKSLSFANCASSPKSSTPSPKISSRKSGESTPTKQEAGTESHKSPPKSVSLGGKSSSSPTSGSSSSKIMSTRSSESSPKKYQPGIANNRSPPKSSSQPSKSTPSPTSGIATRSSESTPTKCVAGTVNQRSTPKSSPNKSTSSPRSNTSSPKISPRRSGVSTPTKRVAESEKQRSPSDLKCFLESTPPKRRPGRPKKLGPQLEQKVKRPIGRPRKQRTEDGASGAKSDSVKTVIVSEAEDNINKNLKITVLYGRSRRNKRMVSEGFGQLQTEFHDACQAVGFKSDSGILMHSSKTSSVNIDTVSNKSTEELNFVSPLKESASQSSRNIICQKRDDSTTGRKPGRPAKVKISGISVTVTTVSPRQRKIQMNRESPLSPEALFHRQVPVAEIRTAKDPKIMRSLSGNPSQTEKEMETKGENNEKLPSQPVAVRHSMRERKPSIHFLHAVATSTHRSYSHSNALLRRSKHLLLNKANNERKKVEQQNTVASSGGKRRLSGEDKRNNTSQDLNKLAGVSVDSIFSPKETLKWWAASAEENTMNQELARRIRLISDTWVSDAVENKGKVKMDANPGTKGNSFFTRRPKHSSVVRSLFDCSPNKPRSCSMQQLCSWFMETTETQSLAITKKASSRNSFDLGLFPRSVNSKSVCHSPQAERLRKHIKKFAKTVPKSPLQHQQAQRRLRKGNDAIQLTRDIRRQLFTPKSAADRFSQRLQWWRKALRNYQSTVHRAKTRFQTRRERERRQKRGNKKTINIVTRISNEHEVKVHEQKSKAVCRSANVQFSYFLRNSSASSSVNQTQEPVDAPKEQNLYSKAWSPETLKECRVFLRKINSPDNESTEGEWDSCTVTLDDGSPSAYVFAGGRRDVVGVVKAVKTERMNEKRSELADSAPQSVQEHGQIPVRRQKGKYKGPGFTCTEPPKPPPAKTMRQSRMRGLSGPRWCDFVFES